MATAAARVTTCHNFIDGKWAPSGSGEVFENRNSELLFRAAQVIVDGKEALARDMTRKKGKVLDETRGDVHKAIDMTFLAGGGRRQELGTADL